MARGKVFGLTTGLILLFGCIANSHATTIRQPSPILNQVNPMCANKGQLTNGTALACLGSQTILFFSAVQVIRYGLSAASSDGKMHKETSLLATLYDAHCAMDLMKSYQQKIGKAEDLYFRASSKSSDNKVLLTQNFIEEGWSDYVHRAKYSDDTPLGPSANATQQEKDDYWKTHYAPKFTEYYVNKTPLAVLKGPAGAFVKEKLTNPNGKVNTDALTMGFVKSICAKKVQSGLMKVVGRKKKSGLSLITDSMLWGAAVDGESKITKGMLFADAAYYASDRGISAVDNILDDVTSDIKSEMSQYGHAEKLKAKTILNNLKSLVGIGDKSRQPNKFAGIDLKAPLPATGLTTKTPVVQQFVAKLDNIVEQGKFFDPKSAIGQHTAKLGVLKDMLAVQQTNNLTVANTTVANTTTGTSVVDKAVNAVKEASLSDKAKMTAQTIANKAKEKAKNFAAAMQGKEAPQPFATNQESGNTAMSALLSKIGSLKAGENVSKKECQSDDEAETCSGEAQSELPECKEGETESESCQKAQVNTNKEPKKSFWQVMRDLKPSAN